MKAHYARHMLGTGKLGLGQLNLSLYTLANANTLYPHITYILGLMPARHQNWAGQRTRLRTHMPHSCLRRRVTCVLTPKHTVTNTSASGHSWRS